MIRGLTRTWQTYTTHESVPAPLSAFTHTTPTGLRRCSWRPACPEPGKISHQNPRCWLRRAHPTEVTSQSLSIASHSLSFTMANELNCAICLDALVRPVMAPCGHSFCMLHAQEWITEQRKRGVGEPACPFRCLLPLPKLEDLRVNRALEDAVALVAAHRAAATNPLALGLALLLLLAGWVRSAWESLVTAGGSLLTWAARTWTALKRGASFHAAMCWTILRRAAAAVLACIGGAISLLTAPARAGPAAWMRVVTFARLLLCVAATRLCRGCRRGGRAAAAPPTRKPVAYVAAPWYRNRCCCLGMLVAAAALLLLVTWFLCFQVLRLHLMGTLVNPTLTRLLPLHPLEGDDLNRFIALCDKSLTARSLLDDISGGPADRYELLAAHTNELPTLLAMDFRCSLYAYSWHSEDDTMRDLSASAESMLVHGFDADSRRTAHINNLGSALLEGSFFHRQSERLGNALLDLLLLIYPSPIYYRPEVSDADRLAVIPYSLELLLRTPYNRTVAWKALTLLKGFEMKADIAENAARALANFLRIVSQLYPTELTRTNTDAGDTAADLSFIIRRVTVSYIEWEGGAEILIDSGVLVALCQALLHYPNKVEGYHHLLIAVLLIVERGSPSHMINSGAFEAARSAAIRAAVHYEDDLLFNLELACSIFVHLHRSRFALSYVGSEEHAQAIRDYDDNSVEERFWRLLYSPRLFKVGDNCNLLRKTHSDASAQLQASQTDQLEH